ncbi:MAG TPA: penicillin-binding transpeptidase domain-containing protein [Solirubrobacteraceae bacterium]|nr:penicillin-binding transpeptidase domain-containing protein [Solirubrobacteraceae bacterium]
MNGPIAKLFGVIVIMFALLIGWTSRWTVFDASSLNANPLNKRTLADDLKIKRGRILADNGEVLAKSVPAGGGTWKRTYPKGSLFSQTVGYSDVLNGEQAGLEQSDDSDLRGLNQGLDSVFGQVAGTRVGDDVYTTLDPKAQQVARADLAGRQGAVVALNPKTGAVLALYANPTYNDNAPTAGGSQFNYATQAYDPPGSTFKIVTATAALDSGKYTPNSMIDGKSPITVSGVPLSNDANEQYGLITLTDALINSVNTVFAQVAESVGIPTMTEYMKRFGFYAKPPIDLPPSQLRASNVRSFTGKFLRAGSNQEDIGRIGIGQGGLLVTPLQMAEVVATVANGGKLMAPHLTAKVVDPTGQTVKTITPTVYSTVMKPATAANLTQMMLKVVEEGTGQPAQLGNISVAGKTGTASIGHLGQNLTEPWFVGFAPVNNPQVAVAVTVQQTQGGYGATVAAPIARDVMQTLLAEGK